MCVPVCGWVGVCYVPVCVPAYDASVGRWVGGWTCGWCVDPFAPPTLPREAADVCLQVMGMLQGKIVQDTFIVIDSFALPVEGTETRVNAQNEAYEYMVDFVDTNKVGGPHTCLKSGHAAVPVMTDLPVVVPWGNPSRVSSSSASLLVGSIL